LGWCGLVGCRGGEGKGAEEGERKREIWREGGTGGGCLYLSDLRASEMRPS